jgi:hypothetical protein
MQRADIARRRRVSHFDASERGDASIRAASFRRIHAARRRARCASIRSTAMDVASMQKRQFVVRRKVEMRMRAQMRRDDRRCSRRRIPTTVRGCTRSKGAQNRTPQIPLIGLAMLAQDKRSGCEGVADFLCDVHGLVDDRFIFVLGWATRASSLDRTRRCWRSMSLFRV